MMNTRNSNIGDPIGTIIVHRNRIDASIRKLRSDPRCAANKCAAFCEAITRARKSALAYLNNGQHFEAGSMMGASALYGLALEACSRGEHLGISYYMDQAESWVTAIRKRAGTMGSEGAVSKTAPEALIEID